MLQSMNAKSIIGIIVVVLAILGFLGIKIFDITISDFLRSIINVKKESATQTAESQLSLSNVENQTETGITQLSPINEANKVLGAQSSHQQTDTDKTGKLEFSMLIGILEDLTSSSIKLEFIRDNMELMPDSLSLVELHQILGEFPSSVDRFAVTEKFLSRLPHSLSLEELNKMLDEFPSSGNKLKVTNIFRSRIKDNYSVSEFERFKEHYPSSSTKKKAIELLLKKNQEQ